MKLNINTITAVTKVPSCESKHDRHDALLKGFHVQNLKEYIIECWLSNQNEICQRMRPHLTFRDRLAMTDKVAMKGSRIISSARITTASTRTNPHEPHGQGKTRLLVRYSVYQFSMNH